MINAGISSLLFTTGSERSHEAAQAKLQRRDPKTGGGEVMRGHWLEEPPSLGTNLKQNDGADYCG